MILLIVAYLIMVILTAVTVDVSAALVVVCAIIVGTSISLGVSRGQHKRSIYIYALLFLIGWIYLLLCYWYMVSHEYSWLLAYDTYDAFIPHTNEYINSGDGNLIRIYQEIFTDYNFFARQEYFYWVYLCTWGVLIRSFGGDLYFGLQVSTLFIFALVGVVLFRIFLRFGFDKNKSQRHTIVICLISIIFFYSSQILRDMLVLLCYLCAIYLSSNPKFSVITILKLLLTIIVTCGIRIESGLFLFITIPTYLLLSLQEKRSRIITVMLSTIVFSVGAVAFFMYKDALLAVFFANADAYGGADKGAGVIGTLQRIPVLGDLLSILYNASQPIPCWIRMIPSQNLEFGGNVSNLMNFPRISGAFFNIMTYVFIFIWLVNTRIRRKVMITKAHRYHLWIGLLFLFLQSSVISQRRLLGYYCVFYILFFLIFDSLSKNSTFSCGIISFLVFALIQFIGVIFLM